MQRIILFLALCFTLTANAQSFESDIDRWYREQSITNSHQPGNAYYTGTDDFADFALQSNNGECAACFTPNPPPFCFEPGHHCHQASMPIDSGVVLLIIGGFLFGAYAIAKQRNVSLFALLTRNV